MLHAVLYGVDYILVPFLIGFSVGVAFGPRWYTIALAGLLLVAWLAAVRWASPEN